MTAAVGRALALPFRLLRQVRLLVANAFRLFANGLGYLAGPRPGYVVIEIAGHLPEREPQRPGGLIGCLLRSGRREEESLESLRKRLDQVADDPRVQGVVLRFGEFQGGIATAAALRMAIRRLEDQGKRTLAYLTRLDTRGYYAATGAGKIVAVESAQFAATGLSMQVTFLKDALARWGIQADIERLAEYKTAGDALTRSDMSEPQREMLDTLLDTLYDEFLRGVAASRGMQAERVRELVDMAPFSSDRAKAEGLLDAVLYEDQLPAYLGDGADAPARLVPWRAAKWRLRRRYRFPPPAAIGVVSIQGTIVEGESRQVPAPLPVVGGPQAGADTIARALRRAERSSHIKAVICHIDSPGGSAVASDLIWREVRRVAQRKPVVAYMGNVAASGGYYAAVAAGHVLAQPETLTGSIGVVGGKLVLQGLFERSGVNPVLLTRGRAAGLFSSARPFSEEEREGVRSSLAEVYERFKDRVATGRSMEPENVEEVARGRVWSGAQALERRLVDELGDFPVAVQRALEAAELDRARDVPVVSVSAGAAQVPVADDASVLSSLVQSVARLDRERIWTLLPWIPALE